MARPDLHLPILWGTPGLLALLLRQPEFFFGDGRELVERSDLSAVGRDGEGGHRTFLRKNRLWPGGKSSMEPKTS